MKRIALLALLLSSSAAFAADLTKAPAPYIPPPSLSWSGFYLGGSVGGGWAKSENTFSGTNDGGSPVSIAGPTSSTGFIGGVYTGYNQQFGAWVAGLETDISWTNFHGSTGFKGHYSDGLGGQVPFAVQFENRLQWLGTTRGRIGYLAVPALLVYGTGGLAYGGVRSSGLGVIGSDSLSSHDAFPFESSNTKLGWAAGAGAEYALSHNLLVRTEFLHYNLGKVSHPAPDNITVSSTNSGNLVRAGLAYKF